MAAGPGEEINAALYDWKWNDPALSVPAVVPAVPPIGNNTYPTVGQGPPGAQSASNWVAVASPMRDSNLESESKAHSADSTGDNAWGLVPDSLPHMEYAATDAGKTVRVDIVNKGPVTPEVEGISSRSGDDPGGKPCAHPAGPQDADYGLSDSDGIGRQGSADLAYILRSALRPGYAQRGPRRSGRPHGARAERQFSSRRREGADLRAALVADMAVSRSGHSNGGRTADAEFAARRGSRPIPSRSGRRSNRNDAELDKIWEISWRTARLDAHETYMDTPYYEQLQYVGDTRIQALISYTVAGDDRLARQALEAFDESRSSGGTDAEPLSELAAADDSDFLAALGGDGARLLDVPAGCGAGAGSAAGNAHGDGLVCPIRTAGWTAEEASVVELYRLGSRWHDSDL